MKNKSKLLLACVTLVISGAAYSLYLNISPYIQFDASSMDGQVNVISDLEVAESNYQQVQEARRNNDLTNQVYEAYKAKMIEQLLRRYGDNISDIGVQASLKEFKQYVLEYFPDFGEALFRDIIETSFPELASQIFSVLDRIAIYDDWYIDNLLNLNDMAQLAKEGLIWEKRNELFGEDADLIWSEELNGRAAKQKAMQQSISSLDKAYEITMDERLYLLQSSIEEQYQGSPENIGIDKGLISGVFFGFDSVQKDLKLMAPEERQSQINKVRRQLGYTEEQIHRMSKKDQTRENRWSNGKSYMAERAALSEQYSGSVPETELAELRAKFFKKEAITIAKEEKDGFYRYERPRLYGRN